MKSADLKYKHILKIPGLVVNDFPLCSSPEEFMKYYIAKDFNNKSLQHDIALFKIENGLTKDVLKKDLTIKYCSSKAYNWQNSILTEPISFGKYSYLLHNAIIDDPKPYRQTVKSLVKNMYCWTISLARNKFKIEKFKHSEILSRTT